MGHAGAFAYDIAGRDLRRACRALGLRERRRPRLRHRRPGRARRRLPMTPWRRCAGRSRERWRRGDRLFADGRFFTADGRARFVPVAPPRRRFRRDAIRWSLNTGRVRDQWHTMTHTGRSPRLSAHVAGALRRAASRRCRRARHRCPARWSRCESPRGPAWSAGRRSTTASGGARVFVPMHWTDQHASAARVDALVAGEDRPGLRPAGAEVRHRSRSGRSRCAWHGFAVLARAAGATCTPTTGRWRGPRNGWRLELAGADAPGRLDGLGARADRASPTAAISSPITTRPPTGIASPPSTATRLVGAIFVSRDPIVGRPRLRRRRARRRPTKRRATGSACSPASRPPTGPIPAPSSAAASRSASTRSPRRWSAAAASASRRSATCSAPAPIAAPAAPRSGRSSASRPATPALDPRQRPGQRD